MRIAKLIALGFAIGALAHATALVLLAFGNTLYGPHYPWWRHALMITTDLAIAFIAVRRPGWLVPILFAFLLEQVVVNGVGLMAGLVAVALIASGLFSRRQPARYRASLD